MNWSAEHSPANRTATETRGREGGGQRWGLGGVAGRTRLRTPGIKKKLGPWDEEVSLSLSHEAYFPLFLDDRSMTFRLFWTRFSREAAGAFRHLSASGRLSP